MWIRSFWPCSIKFSKDIGKLVFKFHEESLFVGASQSFVAKRCRSFQGPRVVFDTIVDFWHPKQIIFLLSAINTISNKVLNDPFNAIHPCEFWARAHHMILLMSVHWPSFLVEIAWPMGNGATIHEEEKNAFLVGREDWRCLLKLVDIWGACSLPLNRDISAISMNQQFKKVTKSWLLWDVVWLINKNVCMPLWVVYMQVITIVFRAQSITFFSCKQLIIVYCP